MFLWARTLGIESVRLTHITSSRDCELASLPVTLEI